MIKPTKGITTSSREDEHRASRAHEFTYTRVYSCSFLHRFRKTEASDAVLYLSKQTVSQQELLCQQQHHAADLSRNPNTVLHHDVQSWGGEFSTPLCFVLEMHSQKTPFVSHQPKRHWTLKTQLPKKLNLKSSNRITVLLTFMPLEWSLTQPWSRKHEMRPLRSSQHCMCPLTAQLGR